MMTNIHAPAAELACRKALACASRVIIPLAVFLLIFVSPLFSGPLEIDGALSRARMGSHLEYFLDPARTLGIGEISSPEYADRFRPMPAEDYSFGFRDAALWLRTVIVNRTGKDLSWVLECRYPLIDDICLYLPRAGGFSSACTGDLKPFDTRPLDTRTFQFPITSPPGESALYLRMSTDGVLDVYFEAWGVRELREKKSREQIMLWLHYGIMVAFFIYNLFIFVSIRDLSYLYLSLFTITFSLASMSLNGLAFQYLWPGYPAWGNIANQVFTNFNCIFILMFSRVFLDTRIEAPRFDRFLLAYIGFLIACFLLIPGPYRYVVRVTTFNSGVVDAMVILCGLYLVRKGSRPAKFFMTAWLFLLGGIFMMVLRSFGLIHEGFLSTWGLQIGMTMMVILLSLGVADKINVMRNEREHALDATREAEEKYRALIETTDTGYVILDEQGRVVDANAEYVRMTGHLTVGDIIGRNVTEWASPEDLGKVAQARDLCASQGFIRNLEIDFVHQDGATVPVEINSTTIETAGGRSILSICRDITYRRTVFQNLMASLREKDVLLKEIHHRVKNNLQIISSLLNLQANKVTDANTLRLYGDMNSRIRAMAIIHERMYQTSDFARVDLADYIRTIAQDLKSAYAVDCPQCAMAYDITPVFIDITRAIPCGLIINEILSNIFKYAFPRGYAGSPAISISLREVDDSTIELVIGDNGVGLPESIIPEKSDSLGLSLIHLLASQLRGTVAIDRVGGTKYTIRFRLAEKK